MLAKKSTHNGQQSFWKPRIDESYSPDATTILLEGDSSETLKAIPDGAVKLIITSPPYNLGKVYEKATALDRYLRALRPILDQLYRVLSPRGSLCWQVGNYVDASEVFPLDIQYYPIFKSYGFKLRNRIIWRFEHGLHASP